MYHTMYHEINQAFLSIGVILQNGYSFFKEFVKHQTHEVNKYIDIYYESVPQTTFYYYFSNWIPQSCFIAVTGLYIRRLQWPTAYCDVQGIGKKDLHVHVLVRKFSLF